MRKGVYIPKISTPASSYTDDFIALTGFSDATIIAAWRTWEAAQEADGIINYPNFSTQKLRVKYWYFLGSAGLTKLNFFNPVDSDVAHRITWNGGVTFGSSGVNSNGTTGYGNTHWKPTELPIDDLLFMVYNRTNSDEVAYDFGVYDSNVLVKDGAYSVIKNGGNLDYYVNDTNVTKAVANIDPRGYYHFRRKPAIIDTDISAWKNGSVISSNNGPISIIMRSSLDLYVLGNDVDGSLSLPTQRQYASFGIGTGFTDTDIANDYAAENVLMTTLGINV